MPQPHLNICNELRQRVQILGAAIGPVLQPDRHLVHLPLSRVKSYILIIGDLSDTTGFYHIVRGYLTVVIAQEVNGFIKRLSLSSPHQ